jgi:hypothetical protein
MAEKQNPIAPSEGQTFPVATGATTAMRSTASSRN